MGLRDGLALRRPAAGSQSPAAAHLIMDATGAASASAAEAKRRRLPLAEARSRQKESSGGPGLSVSANFESGWLLQRRDSVFCLSELGFFG